MDILMIGLSNAGKTTFVSTMYAAMNQGVSGFLIRSSRAADHDRLRRSADQIRRGIFPPPSDRRNIYSLQLWHQGNRVFDFNWRDYRGGALLETSASPQAAQLRADMKKADGLVFIVDSTELVGGLRARSRLRPVISTAVRLLSECEFVIPVVLALTKWDLVVSRQDEVIAAAREMLGPLIDSVRATKHLQGAVIPIACGPWSQNVELPALWCLHVGIYIRGTLLLRDIEFHEQRMRVAQQRRGFLDTVVSAWKGEPTWDDVLRESQRIRNEEVSQLAPLITPSQELGQLFESIATF